jgi:ABC-2 type transport system permease protein
VTFVIAALYLGALLRLPRWLIDVSPAGRTTAPSSVSVVALSVMTLIAVAITAAAGWLYRRRDVI